MNQLEFSKKDKYQEARKDLFNMLAKRAENGAIFDIPKVCRRIEYSDLSVFSGRKASEILDILMQ